MKTLQRILTLALLALLASCANTGGESSEQATIAVLKASFAEKGPAKLDRLDQSALQQECSQANGAGKHLDENRVLQISQAILERIPYPKDGVYLGDWKEGEKIAQNGRGLQLTDVGNAPNGANCYACHQLSPSELSFGNMGPSLLKYGALRGVKDPSDKASEPIVKYTWARIWNTHAFAVCSNMPRFGDSGILTEKQIKDVMALLLDPNSPVNK
jgi:L-cysteine S-thiosulfotransferase